MGDRRVSIIRWKYVAPRLLLVMCLAGLLHFGCDPFVEWLVVTSGQTATGAKVELAELETSLLKGQLVLEDLQVANPKSVMSNLFQVERVNLHLDPLALLHKRVVILNGEINGLRFDVERTSSGELEVPDSCVEQEPSTPAPLFTKADDLASDWLDQVGERLDADFVGQLQTPQVAKKLVEKWKAQSESLRSRSNQLKQRGKQLAEQFREIKKNPLRGAERLPELHVELKSNQQELLALQAEIKALPDQAKTDRQALASARQRDESFLRQQFAFNQLDGDNLTQVLLGQTVAEKLQDACDWIAWVRKKSSSNSSRELAAQRSRGTNVTFGQSLPQFEVKLVGVELTAPVAGHEMQFVGYLSGVSSAPHLLKEPAKLELAALGEVPLKMLVVSDHRGEIPQEELHLACPALPFSGHTLGNAEKLAVELAPGSAELTVDLKLVGNALSGQIKFDQENMQLSPLANSRVNKHLASVLGGALGNIKQVTAEVELAGTLESPRFKINSPIGKQLANEISTAVANLGRERGEALLAEATSKMNVQMEKLEQAKINLQQELLANLGENQKIFEDLAGINGLGERGISVPQLGSTLGRGIMRK